jgi:RHS repeat-associated protein
MISSTKGGTTTNYTYNALGQLIKKGANALYYYDEAGHILGIYTGSGALTEEIVWLGDIPIATLRPRTGGGINIYNIHTDHLNTPRLITGSTNPGARWRWDADPFGVGVPKDNPTGAGAFEFNLRFPWQIYFAETEVNYNYYRDGYDSTTGRYTQSDPVGLYGGLNTYAYGEGNPIWNSDPKGLSVLAADAALVGGVCVAACAAIPSCRDAARNFIQSVRSNPVIDPDKPISPQLPGYIDPGLTCPTTQADSCPPMREPPSPRDRCVNAVNLRFAACLSAGRNPLLCQTQRIFGLVFCNSSSSSDSGE